MDSQQRAQSRQRSAMLKRCLTLYLMDFPIALRLLWSRMSFSIQRHPRDAVGPLLLDLEEVVSEAGYDEVDLGITPRHIFLSILDDEEFLLVGASRGVGSS